MLSSSVRLWHFPAKTCWHNGEEIVHILSWTSQWSVWPEVGCLISVVGWRLSIGVHPLSTAESQQLCLPILFWRKILSFHQITSQIQSSKLLSQHLLVTLLKIFMITDCIPVSQKGMFLCFGLFCFGWGFFCSRHAGFSSFTLWQLWYIRAFLFLTAECKSCLMVLGKLCSYT